MWGLYCTIDCIAFAVGTVTATKALEGWKGNVQSFCPVMKIAMNANQFHRKQFVLNANFTFNGKSHTELFARESCK